MGRLVQSSEIYPIYHLVETMPLRYQKPVAASRCFRSTLIRGKEGFVSLDKCCECLRDLRICHCEGDRSMLHNKVAMTEPNPIWIVFS